MENNNTSKSTSKKIDWKKMGRIAVVCTPAILIVLIIAVILSLTVFFKVDSFEISGEKRYPEQTIIEASGIEKGKNMFRINIDDAQENLEKKLPYIENAEIKRTLSGTIIVTVKECKEPIALRADKGWCIINSEGKVMELLGEQIPEEKIVRLISRYIEEPKLGEKVVFLDEEPESTTLSEKDKKKKDKKKDEDKETPLDTFKKIKKEIDATSLKGSVGTYNLSDPSNIRMSYDSRIVLEIGSTENLKAKITLAAGALANEDKIDPNQSGTMDLTIDQEAHFRPNTAAKK